MSRYFLHVYNREIIAPDEEGIELDGVATARGQAISGIRSIIAEEALNGVIDLGGHVDIANADGETLLVVPFREAFDLRLDD